MPGHSRLPQTLAVIFCVVCRCGSWWVSRSTCRTSLAGAVPGPPKANNEVAGSSSVQLDFDQLPLWPLCMQQPRAASHIAPTCCYHTLHHTSVRRCNQPGEDQKLVWRDITHRIGTALHELERRAPRNVDQVLGAAAAEYMVHELH